MTTVYLAGPMTGLPDWNYPAFHTAAKLLRDQGVTVLNPAEHFDGDTTLPRYGYLREAVKAVSQADYVVLLGGWESSDGVRLELDTADGLDIPAYEFGDFYHWVSRGDSLPVPVERKPEPVAPRADVLREAADLITGDRNAQYGPPTQDFQRSADALSAMGYRVSDRPLLPHDIAIMVAMVKISRLQHSPQKRDNWTDLAGYAGCGYECAITENTSNTPTNPNARETA